jgi:Uma2 family endonuclease
MSVGAINFENQLRIPADVFDLRGFRAWAHSEDFPQSGKISFIDSQIEIDMSPEELSSHNTVKFDLYVDFGTLVRRHKLGRAYADGALLVNEIAGIAGEPDLMFCTWDTIQSERVIFASRRKGSARRIEVRGTPDLVAEIVSDSSVRKDTILLRKAYYEAGIPEYWLIDARGATVKFQILVRGRSGYVAVKPDSDGYLRSRILSCQVRLIRERDQVGCASYRLLCQ